MGLWLKVMWSCTTISCGHPFPIMVHSTLELWAKINLPSFSCFWGGMLSQQVVTTGTVKTISMWYNELSTSMSLTIIVDAHWIVCNAILILTAEQNVDSLVYSFHLTWSERWYVFSLKLWRIHLSNDCTVLHPELPQKHTVKLVSHTLTLSSQNNMGLCTHLDPIILGIRQSFWSLE